MARINVDDSFFADPRYRVLVASCGGNDALAIGLCVQAWSLAQRYWANDRKLVPEKVWASAKLELLIETDLAERRPEGVYCRGAEKQFEWLVREKRSAAGKRSVEARRKKYGTAAPAKKKCSTPRTPSNKTELPVQSCSTFVQDEVSNKTRTDSNSLSLTLCNEIAKDEAQTPKAGNVWSAYVSAYQARYREAPVRNAKQMGMCAQLVKRLGGDAAVAVVRYYLSHQNAYYVQKSHALGPCLLDCEGLHTQMKTGMAVTRSSASHADKGAANKAAFDAVAAKWAAEGKLGGGADGE